MIIPGNDPLTTIMNTHTKKKKRYQKETKKIEELCTHQICVHAPSSKSTTGHYSTIKIVLFAMSMCITSIIYLLLYGYTMITYLLIMMINTTTTMYTKICISYKCQIILAQWQAAP